MRMISIFTGVGGFDLGAIDAGIVGAGGNNMPTVARSGVRRLTPRECERLQGFPDDWTEMVPDSSRYKQMGNAITVPVASYVLRRVIGALSDV